MTTEQIERRAELKAGLDAGKRYRNQYGVICYMDMTNENGPYVIENGAGHTEPLRNGWSWLDWEEILSEPAWEPKVGDRVIGRDSEIGRASCRERV